MIQEAHGPHDRELVVYALLILAVVQPNLEEFPRRFARAGGGFFVEWRIENGECRMNNEERTMGNEQPPAPPTLFVAHCSFFIVHLGLAQPMPGVL
jgi:hypothetical protein